MKTDWRHAMKTIDNLLHRNVRHRHHLTLFNAGTRRKEWVSLLRAISVKVSLGWWFSGEDGDPRDWLIWADDSRHLIDDMLIGDHVRHFLYIQPVGFVIVELNPRVNNLALNLVHLINPVQRANPIQIKVAVFDAQIETKYFWWWCKRCQYTQPSLQIQPSKWRVQLWDALWKKSLLSQTINQEDKFLLHRCVG